jgi:HAE1 family hydrophobic/amphiphilic exporter-1
MDVRSTIIIGVSIPISLIATFGIMYLQGLTLNIMTLSGLALGVGMLVDNSIVVLENIYHYVERGLSRAKAALIGTEEMLLPIVASTITTIVVFLPIIFVNKEIRILYSGLAMTVTYSLIVSLFVAVTFVPLLSSFRNRHIEMRTQRAVAQAHGPQRRRFTYRLKKWYMRFIGRLLRLRYLVIVLSVVAFIVAIVLYNTRLEKEFIGVTEPEDFTVFIELPTGAKLEISDYAVSDVEQLLAQVSEVKSYSSRVEPWSSKLYVKLVPITQRKRSTKDIIESLREQVNAVEKKYKEAFIYFEEQQEVETNEILLEIFGYNYDTLNELAVGMLTRMQAIEGLTDLKIRWRKGRPEWHLVVDKQKAALYGLTVEQISNILHAKLRGMRATLYHTEGKEVEVITRLENVDRQKLDQLRKLMIALPTGEEIALEQVVKFVYGIGPSKIWRKNKNRMIQVSANRGRYAFGTAAKKIEAVLKDMKFPEEYFYRFGDNYWRMIENQRQLTFALLLTVALIYLVLASLFESYFYPFVIMISVPLAIVGAVLGLLIFKKSVNIGALMGAMILGGVVVNNAIIFIDHFLSLLSQKTSYIKAIIRAGGDRFRPISMTVGTTILGLLPMAIDRSSEASLWSPLAITVMGGLISSTFLTLIVLPCILLVIKDLKKKRTVS